MFPTDCVGNVIREFEFDNPVPTVMWLGFFYINASSGLFNEQ